MTQFPAALRALLDERRLSQAALARLLGITPQAVSSWINGDSIPSHENVTRTETVLEVHPRGSLVELAGYNTRQHATEQTVESLLRADPGFDDEDKRALLRIISLARMRHELSQLQDPADVTLKSELQGLRDDLDRQREMPPPPTLSG